jgi:hypothetical protein
MQHDVQLADILQRCFSDAYYVFALVILGQFYELVPNSAELVLQLGQRFGDIEFAK